MVQRLISPPADRQVALTPQRQATPKTRTGWKWKCKAFAQHVCSCVPLGEHLHYFLQRHVTRSLPRSEEQFAEYVGYAQEHLLLLGRHAPRPFDAATFYEFGAGWDLIVPLTFHAEGVGRQLLVDIRPLMRVELVNDAIYRLHRGALLPRGRARAIACLREAFGIEYHAPADARSTPFATGSVDYVTSTNTLEHIPPDNIRAILRECHRLLGPGGLASFRIDYQDHYSYFDATVSPYHFLRYDEAAWAWYNPSLHYQNRLRHRDYLQLFRETGFEVVEERCQEGTEEDLEALRRMPLDPRFAGYRPDELAVRNAFVVLRKRNPR